MIQFGQICCGCEVTLPALANNTAITADDNCGAAVALPYTRDDAAASCSSAACRGPWPWRSIANTFTTGATAKIDRCIYGIKNAVSKKIWGGRYGFTDDYIANPKVGTHFKHYEVHVVFSEAYSSNNTLNNTDGSFDASTNCKGGNSGSANSNHDLTAGGLETCLADAAAGEGYALQVDSTFGDADCFYSPPSSISVEEILSSIILPPPSDVCACPDDASRAAARALNIANLKSFCYINSDRSVIRVPVPGLGTYLGPASGFSAWVSAGNFSGQPTAFCNGVGNWETVDVVIAATLTQFKLTNTELSGTVTIHSSSIRKVWTATDHIDGTCTPLQLIYDEEATYDSSFSFSATLAAPYTYAQAQADAKGLLNVFDFTKDDEFPWTVPDDCRISPMVSLWEMDGTLTWGYCDTTPDPTLAAIYDGTVRGALMNYYGYAKGIYNKGWFDFAMDFFNFTDDGDGDCESKLCYQYGGFITDFTGVTMATQVVAGAGDTSACGPGWSPFSRYLNHYILPVRPPYIDVSCAYVADGGDGVYASKWAEKKVPLPAQNFWGACGSQRTATLLDSSCNDTATLRWPAAWSICGKAPIASMTLSGDAVTVNLSGGGAPALRTGDIVDFIDAGNTVTVSDVVVTVVNANQFYFVGSVPAGVAVKSHGSPDPKWYDLAPKGDFVFITNLNGTLATSQENIVPTSKTNGIIFIGPVGSPEINNPKWPTRTTRIYSDYPQVQPLEHWYAAVQQMMADRFFTAPQDDSMSDGAGGCTRLVPPPLVPLVEARLVAPAGAPHDFSGGDGNIENKMPAFLDPSMQWGFRCSGAWNVTYAFSPLPYDKWPGVNTTGTNATGDQYDTGATGDQLNAGLGTA